MLFDGEVDQTGNYEAYFTISKRGSRGADRAAKSLRWRV